jgi:putative ABC transport system substrate-binding protein
MPFLFVVGNDPIELGLVESLGRPGGDATGLVIHTLAIGPKRLDLLHQMAPKATVIGALLNPTFPAAGFYRRELEEAVRTLGLSMHFAEASREDQLTAALTR